MEKIKKIKCSFCKKQAEFYSRDERGDTERYFCQDHALEYLKKSKEGFLPRLKKTS